MNKEKLKDFIEGMDETIQNVYKNYLDLANENKEGLIKYLVPTPLYNGKESKNSLSFKNKSALLEYFKIGKDFEKEMRDSRITTIHSSALLAFLAFYKVSEDTPIYIDDIKYTQRFFEVKNKCIRTPSQVDVVLVSSDWKNVLYLESKFKETLEVSSEIEVRGAYRWKNKCGVEIYKEDSFIKHTGSILKGNKDETFKIAVRGDEPKTYLDGIKQMISHYIGMLNGSNGKNEDVFEEKIKEAKNINLASIVYDFPNIPNFKENSDSLSFEKRLENYGELYEKLAKYLNTLTGKLKEPSDDIKYSVREKLLTYQNVFSSEDNKKLLSCEVKSLFNIGN